jgi:hypothetical protein
LLVAPIRVGHIHLMHQTHLAFAARICVGGIGRNDWSAEEVF